MPTKPNWFVGLPVKGGSWFTRVSGAPTGVDVFHPDDLHMTVAFLGTVTQEAAERAFGLAADGALVAVDVVLGEVVPMGKPARWSALSAIVPDAGPLSDAIAQVRGPICAAAGARMETRPPRPHVTLARLLRRASPTQRAQAVEWAGGLDLGRPRIRLDQVALFTWAIDRRRRRFQTVATRSLQGGDTR